MTTETQSLSDSETPPAPDNKLPLDDFNDALGDIDIAQPSTDQATQIATQSTGKGSTSPGSLEALYDIPVNITVVLGQTSIEVTDLLALNKGDVVELDRKVGEAIDIYVNNRLVARGEVVLVEDRLGITMTEIIKGNSTG